MAAVTADLLGWKTKQLTEVRIQFFNATDDKSYKKEWNRSQQ